jgi:iron(III) transport system substrate-binding protein
MKHFIMALALVAVGCGPRGGRVVLYCAQDRPFAEAVLGPFQASGGPALSVKYDTEANKSVGLYRELQLEARRPRCDVHWNNEIITTLMLAREGLLDPYASPAAQAYPDFAKAADHTWHAFAARARVLLIHAPGVADADRPRSLLELTDPKWKGRLVMAKPNFGTTATQAACLFEVLGPDAARAFYRGLKANGVRIVAGNKQVAEAVGRAEAAVGLTDTDDAMDEVNAGRPVAVIFPDADPPNDQYPRLGTLFIPNTVAVIKGCPNPANARRLVDYLLSADVEAKLASAGGYQIPLNPAVAVTLPPALAPARTARPMRVDFAKAASLWDEVQAFLRDEFAR